MYQQNNVASSGLCWMLIDDNRGVARAVMLMNKGVCCLLWIILRRKKSPVKGEFDADGESFLI